MGWCQRYKPLEAEEQEERNRLDEDMDDYLTEAEIKR